MFEEYNQKYDTREFDEKIECCDSIEELKYEILPLLQNQRKQWQAKINHIIKEELHCTQSKFEQISGFSRTTIHKWCQGAIPKSRDHFIKIGLAAQYDIEKMNILLQKYGRYSALYSKTLEDCICMYVLLNYKEDALAKYKEILLRMKNVINKQVVPKEVKDTYALEKELEEIQTDEEMNEFLQENSSSFSLAYRKLYVYILEIVNKKSKLKSTSVHNMAKGQEWSSSLEKCVSAIRTMKWYPTRNKIISLGLHLSMTKEEINEMLALAGMGPLYSKNVFENVILYILTSAELNNLYVDDNENYDIDNLCNYAKTVFDELDIQELEFFLDELPKEVDEWGLER